MGTLKTAGKVVSMAYYPCANPDPIVILEAAGAAAGITMIEAISFGCRDIVKMRAGISPWHARGMKALIGGVKPPDDGFGLGKLLKFTIPIEKALFIWFVADLTLEFVANWHSMAFQFGACGNVPDRYDCSGDNPAWVGRGGDVYSPVAYDFNNPTGNCHNVFGFEFQVPPGWYYSASFDLTAEPIHHGDVIGNIKTTLFQFTPGAFFFPEHDNPPPWFGNKVKAIYHAEGQNKHGGTVHRGIRFLAASDVPARATGGSANVTMSQTPFTNTNFKPLGCFDGALGGIL